MSQTLFYLGATGYIGSQVLVSIKKDAAVYAKLKEYTLVALVRNPEDEKSQKLLSVWPGIVLVKGTLDDTAIIEEQAEKSNIVFNAANSDHEPSIKAIISGLQKRSAAHPSETQPLYIHISGLVIISDNSRGELVPEENQIKYPDTKFNLNVVPSTNVHQAADGLIYAAGTQKETPISTLIVYPSTIYGLGEGVSTGTLLYKLFPNFFIQAGHAGTWGPGHNRVGVVHIKDAGSAFTTIFKLALEGKAKVGEEGFYFINADEAEPLIWHKFAGAIGKVLHEEGLLPTAEVKPLPEAVSSAFGEIGWKAFGGNWAGAVPERLKEAGWVPVETKKLSLLESLPSELNVFVQELKKGPVAEWGGLSKA